MRRRHARARTRIGRTRVVRARRQVSGSCRRRRVEALPLCRYLAIVLLRHEQASAQLHAKDEDEDAYEEDEEHYAGDDAGGSGCVVRGGHHCEVAVVVLGSSERCAAFGSPQFRLANGLLGSARGFD